MYNKTIILKSRPAGQPAGLLARAGRSLCRRRPVSMPASAGLYAGQPLFDCVAVPSGGFFSAKKASKKKEVRISKKIGVCFEFFAILANVDLNLRLKICKIAI